MGIIPGECDDDGATEGATVGERLSYSMSVSSSTASVKIGHGPSARPFGGLLSP